MQVQEAGNILLAFLAGLFFFSLNKILLNIFYAMHAAWIPALIALSATMINIILNMLFIEHFQAVGLATATTISSIFQSILFISILHKRYNFKIYVGPFLAFIFQYMTQLTLFGIFFIFSYHSIIRLITYTPTTCALFFTKAIGLWLWVGPLAVIFLFFVWYTRKFFKIKLYFLP